jgi:hypothetical protein
MREILRWFAPKHRREVRSNTKAKFRRDIRSWSRTKVNEILRILACVASGKFRFWKLFEWYSVSRLLFRGEFPSRLSRLSANLVQSCDKTKPQLFSYPKTIKASYQRHLCMELINWQVALRVLVEVFPVLFDKIRRSKRERNCWSIEPQTKKNFCQLFAGVRSNRDRRSRPRD